MDKRSRFWDLLMIALLVGSIALVFWYEALEPNDPMRAVLEWADLALVAFFVVEWLWRVRVVEGNSGRYALRNSWELLGMVPLMLPVPAFLRALRMLRVVRILRVFRVVGSTLGFFQRVSDKGGLKKVGIAAAVVTIGGAVLVWLLERADNPAFSDLGEAVWWAIVTVTTVGYGDKTPITTMGRFVASILMVLGIGLFSVLAASMASVMFEEEQEEQADLDLTDNLERLAAMHGRGQLSDDEFARAKERILAD